MRFVSLRPGCVAGLGDMMRERERERCCDTGADTWTQLGPGRAQGRHYSRCTVYCAHHQRLEMKEVTRMRSILGPGAGADHRGMMDVVRGWSD